jgi:carbonic anhydrase/acetyltransferase-like protein (isoleucine patch superfamily)
MNTMNKKAASILAVTLIGFSPLAGLLLPVRAQGVDKEVSLVTRQPMGELAVAGRLSVDLHTEFMLSRSFGTEAALNWYNCGYSGGGRGGTTVGGNFGDFGFQVPYQDREQRYPHAVLIGPVRAVHFDGNDFLASNIPVEPKILDSGKMAVEVWFRAGIGAGVLLGWQSRDGRERSAPVGVPPGAGGSAQWQHLVGNCNGTQEDWYLNGLKITSGQRQTLPKAGHVMVLGGASAAAPSFKGELVAVRLHDEAMSPEEITHNFKGGVALGTEIHDWWRTEPGQWWVKTSKHFRHCVDKKAMAGWNEQQRSEFRQRVPGMFDLAELIYHVYSERLAMRSSVVSIKPEERGDGIKYSVPIEPADGSWMGFDGHFGWALQGAGFINPHELVHGWQAMTGGMAGNYWETHANFPQTYAGIYQGMPIVMRESSLFPANGRTYYHDRAMFEHLAQTPAYGPMFIAKLWYDGPSEPKESPYPWISFQRVNPIPEKTLADEYARMVMRNVTWDFKTFKECNSLASFGNGPQESPENRYLKEAGQYRTDALQTLDRSRVLLQQIPHDPQWWRVPKEQAPQQLGWNLCPLSCKPGRVSAMLEGYVDGKRGSDWRTGFVGVDARGKPVYGEVFGPGRESVFVVSPGIKELYLAVAATPSNIVDIPMVGDYRSFEQEPFPYRVKLTGCAPLDVMIRKKPKVAGRTHANGGGFVETSAQVAATAFVGRQAMVLGSSKVLGQARIEDHAVVRDATVKDRAVVSGHALVCEQAVVAENAKVRDFAVVRGETTVSGNAKVLEHAVIDTHKTCSGNVVIKGVPYVYGGNQSGSAMIDGFYAKNNEVTGGKWFTWSWGQGKNSGEEDQSFGGLYADYDFDHAHGWMARDAFGATWGYVNNGAPIEPGKGRLSGTDGALRLNGKNQFVELQKDVADMSECTYTAEINWDGARDGERIFEFSNASGDQVFLSPSMGGKLVFAIRKDNRVEEVTGPALAKNVWTTVQVICNGSGALLIVDGAKVAERAMTLRPDSFRADRAYLGRGIKGDYFGGLIGRFTVHAAALIDRTPSTPSERGPDDVMTGRGPAESAPLPIR